MARRLRYGDGAVDAGGARRGRLRRHSHGAPHGGLRDGAEIIAAHRRRPQRDSRHARPCVQARGAGAGTPCARPPDPGRREGRGLLSVMALVFWISVGLIAYVYAGYPLLLHCRVRIADWRSNRGFRTPQSAMRHPQDGVSIVIAARNEAARLPARLDNLLSLGFPSAQRQIIVVSDGSTDNTLEVLARYRRSVDVVSVPAGG